MLPRELLEEREIAMLKPYATKSAYTLGRVRESKKCDLRTEFQKDRDRITHSKAFRRLMHKTQVFISPEGDHYRTRLTHTLEVAQIARTVSRVLGLNEDLTEAIALGHDLGHTPFGHTGEDALDKLVPGGFRHNEQSVRVVEELNLTREVIDGILNHRTAYSPATPEGRVVQLSDKIAWMNHDIDDALRAKLVDDLPPFIPQILGRTISERINFLVLNLISYSSEMLKDLPDSSHRTGDWKTYIALSPSVTETMSELREYLFANVYANQLHIQERAKIQAMLKLMYEYYMNHLHLLPSELNAKNNPQQAVTDYIACMTDRFAEKRFKEIFIPTAWEI